MMRGQLVPIFSRRWIVDRAAFVSVALLCLLAAPLRSPAQEPGVRGIPPGPANARGLNGSVNDPSGIGNAARVPAIPPPTITPVVPTTIAPSSSYRPVPVQRTVRLRRTRYAPARPRRSAARAAVREPGRLGN